MHIDELITMLEAQLGEMDSLKGKVVAAPDDKARADFQTAFDVKAKEFDDTAILLEAAKVEEARAKVVADAKALRTPATEGLDLNPPNQPGTAAKTELIEEVTSEEKEEHRRNAFFLDYAADPKTLSVEGRNMLAPRSTVFLASKNLSTGAVMLPKKAVAKILGRRLVVAQGKVTLSTDATEYDTDSGASNLLAPDYRADLLREPIVMPNLFQLARQFTSVRGTIDWPMLDQANAGRFGGVIFTWKSTEGADKGEVKVYFTDFQITTSELSGYAPFSNTALRRSSIDLEKTITDLFRDATQDQFSERILNGTGSDQPMGIINASGVNDVARQGTGAIQFKDLTNLKYSPALGLRLGSIFIVADEAEKHMHAQIGTNDRPLFTVDVTGGMRDRLVNHQYVTHEYADAAGATNPGLGDPGDVIFGNMKHYAFAMEEEISIDRSDHVQFLEGRVVFRLMTFAGGKPIYDRAFSILNNAS